MIVKQIIFIALGGALGTGIRFSLLSLFPQTDFPLPTLIANLLGSFFLGFITSYHEKKKITLHWHIGLSTGFCGALTTMSTFAYELVFLFSVNNGEMALFYFLSSILGGLVAAFLGMRLSKKATLREGEIGC